MARTMDLSFLRSMAPQGNGNGNSKSTITFSFLKKEEEPQNNNNPSSVSSVLIHEDHVTDDDSVCLHFSVGDLSCSTCDYKQLVTNNKRQQQQQLTLKNKKPRIIIKQQHKPTTTMLFSSLFKTLRKEEQHNNNNNPSSSVVTHDHDRVCLHFSVGDPCCPSCDYQQQPITDKKRKRSSQQQLHFSKKQKHVHQDNNIGDAATVVHVARNWGYSTALVLYEDPWKIKKVLTKTDLGSNCNILIKRELAKDLIVPVLGGRQVCENQDVHVRIWDSDTNSLHSLVFAIRPSNQSHVSLDTWIRDFVHRRNLQVGDEIGFLWDRYNQQFVFSVIRAYRHDQH